MLSEAPIWVQDLARQYYAGRTCLFILHGNIHDRIWYQDAAHLLPAFLQKVVFRRRQTVFSYNRAAGITFRDSEGQQLLFPFCGEKGRVSSQMYLPKPFPFCIGFYCTRSGKDGG
jgi:hypothetical protein